MPGLYHETITVAFVLIIAERLGDARDLAWTDFAASNPDLLVWKPSVLAGPTLRRCWRPSERVDPSSCPIGSSEFVVRSSWFVASILVVRDDELPTTNYELTFPSRFSRRYRSMSAFVELSCASMAPSCCSSGTMRLASTLPSSTPH